MTARALLMIAAGLASPALAQHGYHAPSPEASAPAPSSTCTAEHAAMGHCTMPPEVSPPPPAPRSSCTPEHAAMGHCTTPAEASAPPPAPVAASSCTPEHAAMGHCTMPPEASAPPPAPVPASSCTPEHAAMGHCTMASQAAGDHSGHDTPAEQPVPPVGPPPPEALSGPPHAADRFFDPEQMAEARSALNEEHGGMKAYKFLVDQLEASVGEDREAYSWDAQFWYGGDIDKLWLKTEGEGELGERLESAEIQALWSRAIDPWFDFQAGVRQDLGPAPDRTHLVLGVQGLAPYWFEVDAAVFVSTHGEVTARAEAEYDLRLTQRLILQPRLEVDFSFQDVPEVDLGSGLSNFELGARLRYEIHPPQGPAVIAPYVGVQYERAVGRTADYRRAGGDSAGGIRLLLGVRTWF